MNNCYGKDRNMQMALVKIYPECGDNFYIKCCVSDTTSTDIHIEEISTWIDDNMTNISHFEL